MDKKKQRFSPEEDQKLKVLVSTFGKGRWKEIAQCFPSRNARQCRERWSIYLDPDLHSTPWSKEDDDLLKEKVNQVGRNWNVIAQKYFINRKQNEVKDRYLILMSKKKNKEQSTFMSQMEQFDEEKLIFMEMFYERFQEPFEDDLQGINPICKLR